MSYFHIPSAKILPTKAGNTSSIDTLPQRVSADASAPDHYAFSFSKGAAHFCLSRPFFVQDTVFQNVGEARHLRSEADSVLDYFR